MFVFVIYYTLRLLSRQVFRRCKQDDLVLDKLSDFLIFESSFSSPVRFQTVKKHPSKNPTGPGGPKLDEKTEN